MRALWKVARISSAVLPVAGLLMAWARHTLFGRVREWDDSESGEKFILMTLGVLIIVHVAFRIILIVLIFLSFRNLPLDIYETRGWLAFLPSFH